MAGCLFGTVICALISFLLCCIVVVFIPKRFLCAPDVSLPVLVSNLSSTHGIPCHTLGTRLGYNNDELLPMADIGELVDHWGDDHIYNGPLFSHGSLYDILTSEEYSITSHEVMVILAFEECSEFVYSLSTAAMYGILALILIIAALMLCHCRPTCCCLLVTDTDTMWGRIVHVRKNRVRTESEQTDTDFMASAFLVKNPLFRENVPEKLADLPSVGKKRKMGRPLLLSCIFSNGEEEILYRSKGKGKPKPVNRLFKKDLDGTLTQDNLELVCEAMRSVGVLFAWDNAKGTVIRIGPSFIITAWHVIKDIVLQEYNLVPSMEPNAEKLACDKIYIDFHKFTRQSPAAMHFKLLPKIVFMDQVLDVAILELDRTGKDNIPPPLQCFSDVSQLNSSEKQIKCVHLIGQHPHQENVVVDFGCKVIDRDDKNVKKARKWMKNHMDSLRKTAKECNENPNDIDTAYFDVFDTQRRLIFNTFLEFGSSGGAVVAILPDGQVALVAVVIHGLPPNYWYSVSCHKFPENMRMEVGCTIKAVKNSQQWKGSEPLRDQLFCQTYKQGIDAEMPMEVEQGNTDTYNNIETMEIDYDNTHANSQVMPMETDTAPMETDHRRVPL